MSKVEIIFIDENGIPEEDTPKKISVPKKKSKKTLVSKMCIGCKIDKPKSEFRRSQNACIECENDPSIFIPKVCCECGDEKSLHSDFRKNRKKCIDCEKAYGRNYRRTTTKAKEWAEANRERMSELQRNHYQKNKTKIRQREYDRQKEDENFRKVYRYRRGVSNMLRGNAKTNKALKISRAEYALWVSFSNFDIEDYPEWHIDHVIPLDMLDDIDVLECEGGPLFRWLNTRPTDPTDNLSKNKYLEREILILHLSKLNQFLEENEEIYEKVKEDRSIYNYRKLAQILLDRKS